jgi:hypothetical protein
MRAQALSSMPASFGIAEPDLRALSTALRFTEKRDDEAIAVATSVKAYDTAKIALAALNARKDRAHQATKVAASAAEASRLRE